jgi:hypothetical protein
MISETTSSDYKYVSKTDKIKWNKNMKDAFFNAIQSAECKDAVQGFTDAGILPSQSSVDQAAQFITNILTHSANIAGMPIKRGAVPRRSARRDQRKNNKQPK